MFCKFTIHKIIKSRQHVRTTYRNGGDGNCLGCEWVEIEDGNVKSEFQKAISRSTVQYYSVQYVRGYLFRNMISWNSVALKHCFYFDTLSAQLCVSFGFQINLIFNTECWCWCWRTTDSIELKFIRVWVFVWAYRKFWWMCSQRYRWYRCLCIIDCHAGYLGFRICIAVAFI